MIRRILMAGSATVAFASVIPGVASATTTVLLNQLPAGAPVTNQYPGLTFTLQGAGSQYGATPAAGPFGYGSGGVSNSVSGFYPSASILDVGFAHPVNNLHISFNNFGRGAYTPAHGPYTSYIYCGKYCSIPVYHPAAGPVFNRGATTAGTYDAHGNQTGYSFIGNTCGYGCTDLFIPGAGIKDLRLNNHAPGLDWEFGLSKVSFDSSAPEPSAWALMIGGFGFVGYMMRRRLLRPAA